MPSCTDQTNQTLNSISLQAMLLEVTQSSTPLLDLSYPTYSYLASNYFKYYSKDSYIY